MTQDLRLTSQTVSVSGNITLHCIIVTGRGLWKLWNLSSHFLAWKRYAVVSMSVIS